MKISDELFETEALLKLKAFDMYTKWQINNGFSLPRHTQFPLNTNKWDNQLRNTSDAEMSDDISLSGGDGLLNPS